MRSFGDITELAASCKFNDCAHVTELAAPFARRIAAVI
jgi:putative ribosome biogenesis GTPase RsgA